MKTILRILPVLALVAAAAPVRADDVTDQLDTARTAYEAGNYSEAIGALDYAGQLIRQKKGETVTAIFPDAPEGWTAGEAESNSSAGAFAGGLVQATRTYRRGESSVTIQIQSDSPLLQTFVMMLNNPIMLTSSGAKLENIKGQKCAVDYKKDDRGGQIKTVVDNRYFVEIDGSDVAREDLVTFAKAIDYAKLTALK